LRTIRALIIAAAALAATTAVAKQPLELEPGQAAELRVAEAGGHSVARRSRAQWAPHDVAAARHMAGQAPPDAPLPTAEALPDEAEVPSAPVAPDAVHLRFLAVADRHAMLVVENGYDLALVYRAMMTRNGDSRPTDVCVVPGGTRSFEYWPHPIERIALSDFRLIPWPEGRPPTCE
jgi:hypothetical protein